MAIARNLNCFTNWLAWFMFYGDIFVLIFSCHINFITCSYSYWKIFACSCLNWALFSTIKTLIRPNQVPLYGTALTALPLKPSNSTNPFCPLMRWKTTELLPSTQRRPPMEIYNTSVHNFRTKQIILKPKSKIKKPIYISSRSGTSPTRASHIKLAAKKKVQQLR